MWHGQIGHGYPIVIYINHELCHIIQPFKILNIIILHYWNDFPAMYTNPVNWVQMVTIGICSNKWSLTNEIDSIFGKSLETRVELYYFFARSHFTFCESHPWVDKLEQTF